LIITDDAEGGAPYARPPMSTRDRRRTRANRLDERHAAAIALVSGVVAAFADASPTGSPWVDRPLVGLVVGVVTWAAASASWWAVSAAAGVAAVAAIDPLLTLIGALGFVGGLWIGVRRRDLATARCLVAAVALNVLVRLELEGFLGSSAIVGIAVGAMLFVIGIRRRSQPIRHAVRTAVGGVLTLVVLAVIGFALTATSARASLTNGQRLATEGIAELGRGNFEAASARFAEAGQAFARASTHLERPWAFPSRLVPVVAQNADVLTDLADAAGDSSSQLGASLGEINPDSLRLTEGRIDLDAIEAIAGPLSDVQIALEALDATVANADSPWLVKPIQSRIASLTEDIDSNEQQLENAVTAAELGPQLLGRDGPRRYLIMFTTPAESRGLGGFMGNFAEIEVVDGQVSVTRFGRSSDLNAGGPDPTSRVVTGPQDWLDQWGRYGFRDGTGTTGTVPWSNITMSPHFPSTAQVVAELYPQSGGSPLDGVFAMDPYVISALLAFTGPVQIEGTNQELDTTNVVDFLLKDQYLVGEGAERVDLLEQVSAVTINRMLEGALPSPVELAESLGELALQGRLVGWSANADEEALFDAVELSGGMPALDGGDGVAVVLNNAAANKIDVYLERQLVYRDWPDLRHTGGHVDKHRARRWASRIRHWQRDRPATRDEPDAGLDLHGSARPLGEPGRRAAHGGDWTGAGVEYGQGAGHDPTR